MEFCILCGQAPVAGLTGYCPACGPRVRLECARGVRRLERYLSAWASFDEWDLNRGGGDDGALLRRAARAASYFPHGYSILSGALADGSLASLHGSSGRLGLTAGCQDGRYIAELVTYASIQEVEGAAFHRLAVEVESEVTVPGVGMTISLYNWRTGRWNRLKGVPFSGSQLVRLTRRSACDYVSPTGDVCLGIRAEHRHAFCQRTGIVRFTVEA